MLLLLLGYVRGVPKAPDEPRSRLDIDVSEDKNPLTGIALLISYVRQGQLP